MRGMPGELDDFSSKVPENVHPLKFVHTKISEK